MKFKLFGIETGVHWSYLVFVFIMLIIPALSPFNLSGLLISIFTGFVLLGSVIGHEYAHALTARYFGYKTKDIWIYFLGGIARIDMDKVMLPKKEFFISIMGPLFNVVMAALSFALMVFLSIPLAGLPFLTIILIPIAIVVKINLLIGVFNLLPIYPMDGGRILRSGLSHFMGHDKGTNIAQYIGILGGACFIFCGIYFITFSWLLLGGLIMLSIYAEKNLS